MAYNKKNYYKRIIKIQNLVLKKKAENSDLFLKEIYWEFVYPNFDICYRTYNSYLGIPAKRELKKLIEQERINQKQQELKQPKLKLW
ncbi:hypothetical protein [Tenacibaculum maritimum]|uniref:hypothetical protein n=1 Tax=Tenacibaculum maritimum TaxID=107401 RepID=UPI0038772FF7